MKRKKGYEKGGSISSDPLTPQELHPRIFATDGTPVGVKRGGKISKLKKGAKK